MAFKDGTQAEGEAFFKTLLDIGPLVNMARTMPYRESIRSPRGEAAAAEGREFRNIGDGSGVIFDIFSHQKICKVAGDATAFSSRCNFYHASSIFSWDDAATDKEVRQINRKIIGLFREKGFQGGSGQYNNYDGGES
ncbi:FAD-linked oxidoreductase [Tolypocladium capitatum]|uniref:FAD-linked oxidoreductase n=1 Tax=Tolypocladium capitatum TaxID=45235 RepID=A0A2K3PU91_9HYPO|nr:FAD-linked oxidoreductase [Tolypocladium capitatum]